MTGARLLIILCSVVNCATYEVSSLCRLSAVPSKVHLDLSSKVFGYQNKFPKQGYADNFRPLTIDAYFDKVELNMVYGTSIHTSGKK